MTSRLMMAVTVVAVAFSGAAVLDGGITQYGLVGMAALALLAIGGWAHNWNLTARLARERDQRAVTDQELAEVKARLDAAGFPPLPGRVDGAN